MDSSKRTVRIARKEAIGMDLLVSYYIKSMGLTEGLNARMIYNAWDNVSGVAAQTLRKYVKNRVLYCHMSSSVVRSQVFLRKKEIMDAINREIVTEPLFTNNENRPATLIDIVLR